MNEAVFSPLRGLDQEFSSTIAIASAKWHLLGWEKAVLLAPIPPTDPWPLVSWSPWGYSGRGETGILVP